MEFSIMAIEKSGMGFNLFWPVYIALTKWYEMFCIFGLALEIFELVAMKVWTVSFPLAWIASIDLAQW